MLEIIALIFLTREIGNLAENKGIQPLKWKIFTIVSWVIAEMLGIIVGFMLFGKNNLFSVILVGLTFAITSYYILKAQLNKLPDQSIDDDINNFGSQ